MFQEKSSAGHKNSEKALTRRNIGKLIVVIILSAMILSIASPFANGALSTNSPGISGSSIVHNLSGNQVIAKADAPSTVTSQKEVNPFQYYSSEPAPVGIADFGLGPSMQPYEYNTSSFSGNVHIVKLNINSTAAGTLSNAVVNGSGNIFLPITSDLADCIGMTSQLNVNYGFYNNGHFYDYWIQDVVGITPINSTSSTVSFCNNIWNFSSPNASIYKTTVVGNGSVSTFIGTGVYAASASSQLPGEDTTLHYPANLQLRVKSAMHGNNPEVVFQYNVGHGWITFDNPYFVFANDVTHYTRFYVEGYTMNPLGLYADAELILGGLGDGLYAGLSPSTDVQMTLQYWNGNNYQYIPNAFNFGSDTGESVSYVTSTPQLNHVTGGIDNLVIGGRTGKLAMVYNISQLSVLSMETPISAGMLALNGQYYNFTGGRINLTLTPGSYNATIYTSSGQPVFTHFFTLNAAQVMSFNANDYYPVTFTETGLSAGTTWSVNVGSTTLTGKHASITYYLPNGTYNFTVMKVGHYHYLVPSSQIRVDGGPINVPVTYSLNAYGVDFIETGLPASSYWYVNITGMPPMKNLLPENHTSLLNGTYGFTISSSDPNYAPNVSSGYFQVSGSVVSVSIEFYRVNYNVKFTETGLPQGTEWFVNVTGSSPQSSTNSIISFTEPEGIYSYSVSSANNNYQASTSKGTFEVSSSSQTFSETFIKVNSQGSGNGPTIDTASLFMLSSLHGVNPMQDYKSEPAPMGIADYGIGPDNVPYFYNTTSFLGELHITRLSVNGTSAGETGSAGFVPESVEGNTVQLNVNFAFVDNGKLYVYWIQNVAGIDPINASSANIAFCDNIWNFSASSYSTLGGMKSTTVQGKGSVVPGTGVYSYCPDSVDATNINYKFSGEMNFPATLELRVNSAINKNGLPEVIFQYNMGNGWKTFDSANFTFATSVSQDYGYVVNGHAMNPEGLYYDAELILGGFGDGTYASMGSSTNIIMTLKYFNGHNYQYVPNAFNFGSDTAESVEYVTSTAYLPSSSGTVGNIVTGGRSGQLSMTYSENQLSVLSILTPVNSGIISFNGKNSSFTGGMVNFTLSPGSYNVVIFNAQGKVEFSHFFTLYANESMDFNAQDYFPVIFTESGLPVGTNWWITEGSMTQMSNSGSITYYLPNGTFSFSAQKFSRYSTTAPSTVYVHGKQDIVSITYTSITYLVSFDEHGLPPDTWYVNLSNGLHNKATAPFSNIFSLQNGTYQYSVQSANKMYEPTKANGTLTVHGHSLSISVTFTSLQQYEVEFNETGLPSGTMWSMTFNGVKSTSQGSSIIFMAMNATYSYSVGSVHGYVPSSSSGSITVDGSNVYSTVSFRSAAQYLVVFDENGLASGTSWSVTMNNNTQVSDGSQIIFQVVNGNYNYYTSASGYISTPSSGTVKVDGSNQFLQIQFTQKLYTVTFTEAGLPPGSQWTVVLNGVSESSTNTTIIFMEPDGTYSFSTYSIALYGAFNPEPSSGRITVNGANASQSILFVPNTAGIASTAPPAIPFIPIGTAGGTGGTATYIITRKFGKSILSGLLRVFH